MSPNMSPEGCFNLLVEVNQQRLKNVDGLLDDCLDSLEKHFKIKKSSCVDKFIRKLEYAYPIPLISTPIVSTKITDVLKKYGIRSVGRFGDWKYEESNQEPLYLKSKLLAYELMNKNNN